MLMAVSVCPSEATLRTIGRLDPDGAAYADLEAHVQECPECLAVLERLAKGWTPATVPERARPPVPDSLPDVPGFVVEREVGQGGMGVVYLAWHLLLKRHVALKRVAGGPLAGERERTRWLREAQAHSRVRHAHVVQIFDVIETDGGLFLVLEYFPEGSLERRLTHGPLSPRDAARLMRPIARAVEEIHDQGLLHLDLKPSNILLDAAPDAPWEGVSPKVSDFGIARLGGESATGSHSGALRGTPRYMAPEQAMLQRGALGPAADIYSLGAMLYHFLTGRPPFQAPSDVEVLDMVRKEEPVPPRRLNARIPRDIETICLKCLQKEPAKRYDSAEDLAEDLGRWLAGDPIRARAVSPLERAWRWYQRRPAIALMVFALALTVIASVAGLSLLFASAVAARNRADAARVRAQDNEQIVSRALREISRSLAASAPEYELMRRERLEAFVQNVRHKLYGVDRRSIADDGVLISLAILDRLLVVSLPEGRAHAAEASEVIAESVSMLRDCLRRRPRDQELRHELTESLIVSGNVALSQERLDVGLRFLDEATSMAQGIEPDASLLAHIRNISNLRRFQAYRELRRGRRREAQRVLDSDLRMFESLTPGTAARVELRLVHALTLAALNPREDALPLVFSALSRRGRADALSAEERCLVAEWLALEAERSVFDSERPSPASPPEELDEWADAVVESIRQRCEAVAVNDALIPLAGNRLSQWVQIGSAAKRQEGRQDEARRIARRFMAVAKQVVRRYPHDADAYMTLSDAYVQTAKNAQREKNEPHVIEALRDAHDAALKASSLDPTREDTRRLLDNRKQRLARALKP